MKEGKIHIYTGDGKGKTTAALGLGLRASGANKKVLIIQFMKPGSSEVDSIKQIDDFEVESYGAEGFVQNEDKEFKNEQEKQVKKALKRTEETVGDNYDLLVLDEIISALYFDFLEPDQIIEIMEEKPENLELVLTGRNAPEDLIERADLVTDMTKVKHYYDEGLEGRKGIEY